MRNKCGADASQHTVRIESSPFLRCLQTGSCIAKALNVSGVKVNYRLCEYLSEDKHFKTESGGQVIDQLELRTKGSELVSNQACGGIQITDTNDWYDVAVGMYPETRDALQNRFGLVAEYCKSYPMPDTKHCTLILVTH